MRNKTFMIVSFWNYPFGGGEEYLYQTGKWALEYGMKVYWISYSDSTNKKHTNFIVKQVDGIYFIDIPGLTIDTQIEEFTYLWLLLIKPDVVHHQGHSREFFFNACKRLRIEFISGYHFWHGAIDLNKLTYNTDILEHSSTHKPSSEIYRLINSQYCTLYSVSKFVTECIYKICNITLPYVVYPGSSKDKNYVPNNNPQNNKYVTIINIHRLKGGELALHLLKKLPDVHFLMIRTEHNSEVLDKEILDEINKRNSQDYAESILIERVSDMTQIYKKTKIFLAPSLVDETFCRTVNEALMNNIVTITTGQGNLKYLVSSKELIIPLKTSTDHLKWEERIAQLYRNPDILDKYIEKAKIDYSEYSEEICKTQFFTMLGDVIKKSKERSVMIIAPWCDQGLGIQARNYYKILVDCGFECSIFSLKPYSASSAINLQKDPSEWVIPNIYYSPNDREHTTDIELFTFVDKFNIGKCIIPETCWFRTFEVAKYLRSINVKCYAVPNIEIVRMDELFKHTWFYKILCNNRLCESKFNDVDITNTEWIGYGILDEKIQMHKKSLDGPLSFLFIGGMNAFSRKHILEICEGFVMAYEANKNISLTCTIQKTNLLELADQDKINIFFSHPAITIIHSHMTYADIIKLYYEHHISIQVSKHEGLGLGFYEALSTGTPIITLDTPPHNEIILDYVNGWLIPCYYKKMTDNPNSLLMSAYFDPKLLCNKILEISEYPHLLEEVYKKLQEDFNKRLSYEVFKNRFVNSLI